MHQFKAGTDHFLLLEARKESRNMSVKPVQLVIKSSEDINANRLPFGVRSFRVILKNEGNGTFFHSTENCSFCIDKKQSFRNNILHS